MEAKFFAQLREYQNEKAKKEKDVPMPNWLKTPDEIEADQRRSERMKNRSKMNRIKAKSSKLAHDNLTNIIWENELLISKDVCTKLFNRIYNGLVVKYGFTDLKDRKIEKFMVRQLADLQSSYETPLCYYDSTFELVLQIRRHFLRREHEEALRIRIPNILKTEEFKGRFDPNDPELQFTDSDLAEWLNIAKTALVPPKTLLVQWLRSHKLLWELDPLQKLVGDWTSTDDESHNEGCFTKGVWRGFADDAFRRFAIGIYRSQGMSGRAPDEGNKQLKQYLKSKLWLSASKFERIVINEVRQIIAEHKLGVTIKTEDNQRDIRDRKFGANTLVGDLHGNTVLNPDILLNEPIQINGGIVHWIEIKNFFVSSEDPFLWQRMIHTVRKYHRHFGTGAIVCRGFEHGVCTQTFTDLVMLDGTRLYEEAKLQSFLQDY